MPGRAQTKMAYEPMNVKHIKTEIQNCYFLENNSALMCGDNGHKF
jgi:hypothetical protein